MAQYSIAPPGNNSSQFLEKTSTLLANNATYTSNVYRVAGWARITGTCFSNQAGSLVVSQSGDGVNWDATSTTSVSASTATSFSVEVVAEFAEVSFTNTGGSTQSTFRLFSYVRAI